MSGGNPNHNPKDGRFSSGSESAARSGDHGATSPSTETRNVPGHGTVLRSKVVAMHGHQRSVGTSGGGGGGQSGGQSGGGRFGGSGNSRARKIAKGQGADVLPMQQVQFQQVQKQPMQFANTANARRAK